MNKSTKTLIKTCVRCGQQKPLSAFLQFSKHGAIYGDICATCHKAQQATKVVEPDETTRRETGGSKIKANERLASEIEKKRNHNRRETLYREEQKQENQQQREQILKKDTKTKDERKHRESFLDNRSLRESREKTKQSTQNTNETPVFGGEEARTKESEIRLDVPLIGTFTEEKYKTTLFRQFTDWLGKPIVSAPASSKPIPTQSPTPKETSTKDHTPADYIRETWGPKKGR